MKTFITSLCLIGLVFTSAVKAEKFVAPSQFYTAFEAAYSNNYQDTAHALIQQYPSMAQFFVDNQQKLNLDDKKIGYLKAALKQDYRRQSDKLIVQRLVGHWQSADKNILVRYKSDQTGFVLYRAQEMRIEFQWDVSDGVIEFSFGSDISLDRVIHIDENHYLYLGGESGKMNYLYRM
ncbi:hypothetical protein AB2S62_19015 [Vibrio sp. NTOU-M3]|uniref:hypothetical protein n=1 Tax=Vibrio sp. NTOU-M3 TaxID=3234954 RepID=UPI00349FD04C